MERFESFLPVWLQRLSNPSCQTVLFFGCGGGFDFTLSLLFIPDLLAAKKKVVILSNSFTDIRSCYKYCPKYFIDPATKADVRTIGVRGMQGGDLYMPEQAVVEFLGERFPDAPIPVYANNVHKMSPAGIRETLSRLIAEHSVDVVVTIDGGTDSIMRGDEQDYATIAEDFVSLSILEHLRVSTPRLQSTMLFVLGFGADRFHGASDASSMRAVAELTRMGGFCGATSINQKSPGFEAYADFLMYYRRRYSSEGSSSIQTIVGSFVAAGTIGQYGPYPNGPQPKPVPRNFKRSGIPKSAVDFFELDEQGSRAATLNNARVEDGESFIWPLMGQVFAFDVDVVMQRNFIAPLFRTAQTWEQVDEAFRTAKRDVKAQGRLAVEDFPREMEMMAPSRRPPPA
jgi:hypothetical protein